MFQNLETNWPNTHAKLELDWFSSFLKNWGRGIHGFVDLLLGLGQKCILSELQPFEVVTFNLGHPVLIFALISDPKARKELNLLKHLQKYSKGQHKHQNRPRPRNPNRSLMIQILTKMSQMSPWNQIKKMTKI